MDISAAASTLGDQGAQILRSCLRETDMTVTESFMLKQPVLGKCSIEFLPTPREERF